MVWAGNSKREDRVSTGSAERRSGGERRAPRFSRELDYLVERLEERAQEIANLRYRLEQVEGALGAERETRLKLERELQLEGERRALSNSLEVQLKQAREQLRDSRAELRRERRRIVPRIRKRD
jgi:chromosome segregation ATPase